MFLKDVHRAEDAFQEVFIRVFKKYGGFKGESSEKTWLIRITVNVCKDMLRNGWLKNVVLPGDRKKEEADAGFETEVAEKDENRLLLKAVNDLPLGFREAVILYYYQDLDTAEIGRMLHIPQGTVRSRLHRAREILKEKLEGRSDLGDRQRRF
jgi:RNA polymerase sigma-70 factor (ECF subfamily)